MKNWFGLDIGSNQVKVLQAEKVSQGFRVARMAAVPLKADGLTEAIKTAIKEAKIKASSEVNVALAESEVFTRIIEAPKLSEMELASSIRYEAEQYIPIALSEVELFHQILPIDEIKSDKSMKVLLIAVPKTRIQQLMQIFDQADLIPGGLETELFSLKRILGDEKKVQILTSFGYKTTDLMVLNHNIPSFTYSANVGGMALTKSLVNELSLSFEQAEEYKKTYGLREDLLEGKVAKILQPFIEEIIEQIKKAMIYLQQQGYNKPPNELILAGGGAMLAGLSGFLAAKLNIEVVIADPFKNFLHDEDFKKKFPYENSSQWATVTGLALKGWL
ncbi:MAG: type IV pilus assembly protein PilM [Candidatus Beckwithbacteria bacterium]|nr:type IV pilus assembly protein PilM [Candidatus Beckwithbacteria bacterium]